MNHPTTPVDQRHRLLSTREVADRLGCSDNHVRSLGLPGVRVGRLIRYRWQDVADLLNVSEQGGIQ